MAVGIIVYSLNVNKGIVLLKSGTFAWFPPVVVANSTVEELMRVSYKRQSSFHLYIQHTICL